MRILGILNWLGGVSSIPIWIGLLLFRVKVRKKLRDFNVFEICLLAIGIYFCWGAILYIIILFGIYVIDFNYSIVRYIYLASFYKLIKFHVIAWLIAFLTAVTLYRIPPKESNLLDWPTTERCIIFLWLYFIIGASGFLVSHILNLLQLSRPFHYADPFPKYISIAHKCFEASFFLLLVIGVILRNKKYKSDIFAHIVIQFIAVQQALDCYFYGGLTTVPIVVIGLSQSALMLILFKPSLAIPGVLTYYIILIITMIGIWSEIIPYAPALLTSPFYGGKLNTYYSVNALWTKLFSSLLMLSLISYLSIRRRNREHKLSNMTTLLKKMFGRYLSTEVMSSLIEDPSLLELGGERREVTIMMTDLRGFTALSERLQPEKVVQMLNAYFEVMVETVLKYNGTINEIIGDALLVIFGAPQEMSDQAERAIACSIEMQNAMTHVNKVNRQKNLPKLEMGIGINKAEVIVGNIGSSRRSKYTVVGSGVNMASRIESYTVGGQILISDSVFKEVSDKLRIDGEQEVYPKGSKTPLKIYEVGGIADGYNLVLEIDDTHLIKLLHHIPLQYSFLGGKHVRKENLKGHIVRLSRKSAEIVMEVSADFLTNIKMSLIDVEDELMSKDFYGKIIDQSEQDAFTIHFTSVPPEINSYFHAYRHHALKKSSHGPTT